MFHSSLRTKVPGDESSRERKFHPMELSSLGTKVLRDESSIILLLDPVYRDWLVILSTPGTLRQCVLPYVPPPITNVYTCITKHYLGLLNLKY